MQRATALLVALGPSACLAAPADEDRAGAVGEVTIDLAPGQSTTVPGPSNEATVAQFLSDDVGARVALSSLVPQPGGRVMRTEREGSSPVVALGASGGSFEVVNVGRRRVRGVLALRALSTLGVALEPLFAGPACLSCEPRDRTPTQHRWWLGLLRSATDGKRFYPQRRVALTVAGTLVSSTFAEDLCKAARAGVEVTAIVDGAVRDIFEMGCRDGHVRLVTPGGVLQPDRTLLARTGFVMLDPGVDDLPVELLLGVKSLSVSAVSVNAESFVAATVRRDSTTAARHRCAVEALAAAAAAPSPDEQLAAFDRTWSRCGASVPDREGALRSSFGPTEVAAARQALLGELGTARSIDLSAYYFGDQEIASALVDAAGRPETAVRVVLDDDSTYGEPEMSTDDFEVWDRLRQSPAVSLRVVPTPIEPYILMRMRAAVLDGRTVIVRGGDFRPVGPAQAFFENVYRIDDDRIARSFTAAFDRLHAEKGVDPATLPAPELVRGDWALQVGGRGGVLVDVRRPDPSRPPVVVGALAIPLEELSGRLGELGAHDRPVVAYDGEEWPRATDAAALLRAAGFERVSVYTRALRPTYRVHERFHAP